MSLLFRNAIGVELDDVEIRAVELQQRYRKIYVSKYDRIPLPSGAVKDGIITAPEEVSNYLKELWKRNKLKKNNIIIGLSNQDVMIRKVLLPDIPKDKLDLLVPNQAQEYIPTPLEDRVLDYMMVGKKEVNNVRNVEILLAAAQLTMVEDFYQCFLNVGIELKDIKISSLSLLDVLGKEKSDGVLVLVDISNSLGNLVICVDGQPRFARLLRINLTESTGLNPANTTSKMELFEIVLSTWTQIIYNEIRTSIQYFQDQENIDRVDRILLSGCGSRIIGLEIEIQKSLDIPVKLLAPIDRIETTKKYPAGEHMIDFTTCIGLALAGLE